MNEVGIGVDISQYKIFHILCELTSIYGLRMIDFTADQELALLMGVAALQHVYKVVRRYSLYSLKIILLKQLAYLGELGCLFSGC